MTFHADDIRSLPYQTIDDLREKVKEIDDQITEMYWDTLGVLINIREPFAYTKEKNPTDLVNRMLVYGNGILDGRITSALIKAGLNPSLGYIHKPMDASASLVLDLNMVFRQHAVDKMVVNAIIKHNNLACHDGKLADKTRKVLTTDLIERLNKVEAIGSSELRFYEIIDEQVNNLLLFLTGGSEAFVPYIRKW